MTCLKCGAEISADATECPRCGVLVAKARARHQTGEMPMSALLDDTASTARPALPRPAVPPSYGVPRTAPPGPGSQAIAPYGIVTEAMIESLEYTRSWVRIIVVSSAIAFLFLAIAGIFAYLSMDALRDRKDNLLLISFAVALSVTAFSFLLFKDYANAIERIRGDQPTRSLEEALAAQARIWRVQGALTVIGWMLVLLIFTLWKMG